MKGKHPRVLALTWYDHAYSLHKITFAYIKILKDKIGHLKSQAQCPDDSKYYYDLAIITKYC